LIGSAAIADGSDGVIPQLNLFAAVGSYFYRRVYASGHLAMPNKAEKELADVRRERSIRESRVYIINEFGMSEALELRYIDIYTHLCAVSVPNDHRAKKILTRIDGQPFGITMR